MKYILLFTFILYQSCNNFISTNINDNNPQETVKEGQNQPYTINKQKDLKEQKNDSTNYKTVHKIFKELIDKSENHKDSLILLNKYNFEISNQTNPISLLFSKCNSFVDQNVFNNKFELIDTIEWYEHSLLHKHIFYVKGNYVLVFDLLQIRSLKECKEDSDVFMLDAIQVYEKNEYLKLAQQSSSPFYKGKIE